MRIGEVASDVADPLPRIQILQVAECPLVDRLRLLLEECLASIPAYEVPVETLVGNYPSPTLLVDGLDVATGLPAEDLAYCRLDLPSRAQILEALTVSRGRAG